MTNYNPSHNNDDQRKFNAKRRKIEPPRKAPDSERGLTHSPYFNGPLYQRMSEDLFRRPRPNPPEADGGAVPVK